MSIGDDVLLKFSGVPLGEACSIVLRGATEQIVAEAERSLHDALCVLHSTVKVIYFCLANSERPLVIAGEEVGSFNWVISIGILVSSEEIFVLSHIVRVS